MRARLAKAENVGSYENPFRVKNDRARNTLGIRSVTRRWWRQRGGRREGEGGGGGKEEKNCGGNRKKFPSRVLGTRAERPENDCSCETQKGSRGFSSQKGP